MASATSTCVAGQVSRNGTGEFRRQDLPDSNGNIVFAFDADWRIRAANWAAEILTGYTRDELLARTLWDLVPADSRMRTKREWLASQDREIPIEIVTRAGDLRRLYMSWTEDLGSGKGPQYLATARDVTASLAFGHFRTITPSDSRTAGRGRASERDSGVPDPRCGRRDRRLAVCRGRPPPLLSA